MEYFFKEAIFLVLIISLVPLAISSIVSLGIAVLQAATQISDQSINYLARFLVVFLTLMIGFSWITRCLINFCEKVFSSLAFLGNIS